MTGDIAFAGFILTAEEWQQLDPESRAQLIAVATRRVEPSYAPARRRLAEGTGPHEAIELLDAELIEDDDGAAVPDPDECSFAGLLDD
jgi:hypothetical protein